MPLFQYSKPGPGVSKNAPPKKRIVLYFEVLGRKIFPLIRLNLLFLLLVVIAATLVVAIGSTGVTVYVACIPLLLLAPFVGGLTYITRNYAREEHAFLLSDFMDAAKSNWKQMLIHGVITYLFIVIMDIAIKFYYFQAASQPIFYVLVALCLIASLIFLFMQYYITLMIITFDLKLKAIYKNAWILSVAGFKQNLFVSLALILFFALLFLLNSLSIYTMLVAILICAVFLFSFISFTVNFAVYPNVEKYLIEPYYNQDRDEEEDEDGQDVKEDTDKTSSKSEYVYENGRLIRKSLLEEESLFDDSDKNK